MSARARQRRREAKAPRPATSAPVGAVDPAVLGQAVAWHRSGRLTEAAAGYRMILDVDPEHYDALHLLGVVAHQEGRQAEAIEFIRRALGLHGDFPEAWNNLSTALIAEGRVDGAIRACRRALALRPEYAEAWNNLAVALRMTGALDEALQAHRRSLSLAGHLPDARTDFVNLLKEQGMLIPATAPDNLREARASLPGGVAEAVPCGGAGAGNDDLPGRVVALLHYGRSGTGLLHGMIDGHPEVTTLPGTYFKGFFGPGVWQGIAGGGVAEMPGRFAALWDLLFDAAGVAPVPGDVRGAERPLGVFEGFTQLGRDRSSRLTLDREAFLGRLGERLAARETVGPGDFFRIVHAAFEEARGRGAGQPVLFYHLHNPTGYELSNFLRCFPDARLLMTMREPLQNIESWLATPYRRTRDYPDLANRLGILLTQFDQIEFTRQESRGVRLEDLKRRPEVTLRALCEWLGIGMEPCLLRPTMQGLRWWGDPTSALFGREDPFDDEPLRREVGAILRPRDQEILGALTAPLARLYGYRPDDAGAAARQAGRIEAVLGEPFAFEREFCAANDIAIEALRRHGRYRFLRYQMRARHRVLAESGSFPHMIPPLLPAG